MKRLFILAFALTSIISCTKEDTTNSGGGGGTTGSATTLLAFVDSAQIFTTDLTGGSRKLAVAAETTSTNEYLGIVQFSADGTKFIYSHNISGSNNVSTIKSCNLDGSNKKVLKTFSTATSNNFLKVLASGKILFGTTTFTGGLIANNIYTMNEDGTSEALFTTQQGFGVSFSKETHVSKSGQDLILMSSSTPTPGTNYSGRTISYLGWSTTGTLTGERVIEISSDVFNDASKAGNVAISKDGSLVAFAVLSSATKFDIYTKETKANAAARKLVYSITVPSDITGVYTGSLKLSFLSGTDKLVAYVGKFTSPRGAATDYTQTYVITIGATTSTDVNFKFTGDDIDRIVPNF